ncbi:MAG: (2Fe-2S)-binding protein [Proteobacteria bacterium]|nr:(2Fe-2S)-binding protein [Pseudomonadota bacterium]
MADDDNKDENKDEHTDANKDEHTDANTDANTDEKANTEAKAKQLLRVVCICKGINLGRVLKGIEGCNTVADVNKVVGTGTGGCQGQRCGPRIKLLLEKMKSQK